MVTRKPVPEGINPTTTNDPLPPYPISPISQDPPPNFHAGPENNAIPSGTGLDSHGAGVWYDEGMNEHNGFQGASQAHSPLDPSNLPDSLRVGGPSRSGPQPSQNSLKPNTAITNPFILRRQQSQGASSDTKESSADAWADDVKIPAHPDLPPPPPPIPQGKCIRPCFVLVTNLC